VDLSKRYNGKPKRSRASSFEHPGRPHRRSDRPERLRQDHHAESQRWAWPISKANSPFSAAIRAPSAMR
jgi:hypothetical protein